MALSKRWKSSPGRWKPNDGSDATEDSRIQLGAAPAAQLRQADAGLKPEYQELKFTLHRKLVDKINLEALATIDNQRVRGGGPPGGDLASSTSEPTLLSSLEKQQISDEVLDEVFGLGPLEPLLQDPTISDILVNTYRQVYVERKGLLELTNVAFPRRPAPAAHHRQDRFARWAAASTNRRPWWTPA